MGVGGSSPLIPTKLTLFAKCHFFIFPHRLFAFANKQGVRPLQSGCPCSQPLLTILTMSKYKVGVGGSSPLIPTKLTLFTEWLFFYLFEFACDKDNVGELRIAHFIVKGNRIKGFETVQDYDVIKLEN